MPQQIQELSAEAARLARSVVRAPSLRASLQQKASSVRGRLRDLSRHISPLAPDGRDLQRLVSEALLDLRYVARPTRNVSLRLAHVLAHARKPAMTPEEEAAEDERVLPLLRARLRT